jgi:short-subunit dehydrogenase
VFKKKKKSCFYKTQPKSVANLFLFWASTQKKLKNPSFVNLFSSQTFLLFIEMLKPKLAEKQKKKKRKKKKKKGYLGLSKGK